MVARLSHRSVTHSRDVNGNGGLLNHTGLVRAIGSLDQQNRHLVSYTLLQRCNYRSGILMGPGKSHRQGIGLLDRAEAET